MVNRGGGGQAGKQAAEIIEIRALLEFQMKVLLGEVEMSEAMLVHEFDNSTDFLEFHGKCGVGSEGVTGVARRALLRSWKLGVVGKQRQAGRDGGERQDFKTQDARRKMEILRFWIGGCGMGRVG